MSVNPTSLLNPTTAWAVGTINLPASDRKVVTDCICKYSAKAPEASGKMQQLLYQVMEKLKSLFNASDWQRAHRALCSKSIAFKPTCDWLLGENTFEKMNEAALRCLVANNKGSGKLILGAHRFLPKVTVDQMADSAARFAKRVIPHSLKGIDSIESLADLCAEKAAQAALAKVSTLVLGSLIPLI